MGLKQSINIRLEFIIKVFFFKEKIRFEVVIDFCV